MWTSTCESRAFLTHIVLKWVYRMAYIEENLKIRSRPPDESDSKPGANAQDEYSLSERWKAEKKTADEGNVTNSMAMLTAIPEVDLGME